MAPDTAVDVLLEELGTRNGMLNFAPDQSEDCFVTYHLWVNVTTDLMDPLEGESDQCGTLGGSSLDPRLRKKKTREEQREPRQRKGRS